jgi:hypothetical protein
MRVKTLTVAALAWAALGLVGAQGREIILVDRPAPKPVVKEDAKSAAVNDPAEPPLKVEVSFSNDVNARFIGEARGGRLVRGGRAGQKVEVASSARGTVLTLNTPGGWQGSANLTFKDSAPPMRFTMRLTRVPNYDLSSLTLTSGALSLQAGNVATGGAVTTKYFDAKGNARDSAEGAAYTVKARRKSNGDVELQLQRGPGAALDKAMSVSWASSFGQWGEGGLGGVIIDVKR